MTTPISLLVAYDIADDRRRGRLHRLLLGFGEPMQKSVFVCRLDVARRERLDRALHEFRSKVEGGGDRIACMTLRDSVLAAGAGISVIE